VEFAILKEQRVDLVWLLEDDTILHLDFQSDNDSDMPYREGIYCLLIARKYRRKVHQVVLFTGLGKMRVKNRLDLGGVQVEYRLMDIRELESETLLRSGEPGDLVLAVLARGGPERLTEILRRVNALESGKRQRALAQLAILSGLRKLAGKFTMEVKKMSMVIDIDKHAFLREIRDTAMAEGKALGKAEGMTTLLREQLSSKFGPLPKWARERLDKATYAQIERWARKILTAQTLEGVLGHR